MLVKDHNRNLIMNLASRIKDPDVQAFTIEMLKTAPQKFWTGPSSSSGKYHPPDEHGEGGLILHTLRVVQVALVMIESNAILQRDSDTIISACLLHDVLRYGRNNTNHSEDNHAETMADLIENAAGPVDIADCVRSHMGRWGSCKPKSQAQWAVHFADNIAAHIHLINGRG